MVLPKFELPGDRPHWAVRAAWITGGLLLASGLGLGAVIVHHRNLENQVQIAKVEAIAKVKAEAEGRVAAAAAAEKARKEAELSAKLAAQSMPATTVPGSAGSGDSATAGNAGKTGKLAATTKSPARRGLSSRKGKGSKGVFRPGDSMAKNDSKNYNKKADSRPASNKPDPIDELLRKMK